MSKTNIFIVEDESIVAKDLQQSLKKLGYNVVGIAASGEDAIKMVEETNPDLIFMDIMLKGELSGIDAANHIRATSNIPVIFLTAYADESTLSKAKISEPYGYIIKPFKEIDLYTSIELALYRNEKIKDVRKERDFLYSIVEGKDAQDVVFVKSNSRLVKIKTDDIYYIEALKDYVVINTANTRYTIHSTMKDIEKKFSPTEFIRVHRSFIVRIDKIVAIDHYNVIMEDNKKEIPVGGSYKEELAKRLNLI
ncbi:MAG TPA: LytTR family transcriptional regulator DNA-binding domain-containing protein [Bacteroidia bacterium]|nr:LytTR family transcriptional regulator DNA-binding domain-containing protein [Bacteroidia bacterium]